MHAAALAQATGTHPDAMHRMMRALVAGDVFALDPLTGGSQQPALGGAPDLQPRSARHSWRTSYQVECAGMGGCGGDAAHGHERFRAGLRDVGLGLVGQPPCRRSACVPTRWRPAPRMTLRRLWRLPFADVHRVCDVAGGRGTLLAHVLAAHPHLCGVLFEAPGVAKMAGERLHSCRVVDRIEIVSGNVFESVPGGCDTYY